jgi:hypothetical protein
LAWTPPSKFTVILSLLILLGGLFVLIEVIFGVPGVLPAFNLGTLSVNETWGLIGLILVFLSWLLMMLGVRVKGM